MVPSVFDTMYISGLLGLGIYIDIRIKINSPSLQKSMYLFYLFHLTRSVLCCQKKRLHSKNYFQKPFQNSYLGRSKGTWSL